MGNASPPLPPSLPSARKPGSLLITPSNAIAHAAVAAADPVPKASYDALVGKFNSLLDACVKAGVLKSS